MPRPRREWEPPSAEATLRLLALLVAVGAFLVAWRVRAAVVFALVTAFLAHPLYAALLRRLRRPGLAASVVLAVVTLVLVAPLVGVGYALATQASQLAEAAAGAGPLFARADDVLEGWGVPPAQAEAWLRTGLQRGAEWLAATATATVGASVEFLIDLVVFFILLYFAVVDGPKLVGWLRSVAPLDDDRIDRIYARIGERVKALVYGTLVISIVQGVTAGVGWWLLGLPAPVFWGFVMVVLAVLPVLGPFIVLIPATVFAALQGSWFQVVGLLVLNFLMVGLIDDAIRPWVVGRWSGVHPAIILVGIVGGVPVFGVSGLVLGPLLLSLLGPILGAWLRPGEGSLGPAPDEDEEPAEARAGGGKSKSNPS